MNYELSIIVPCYNVPIKQLRQCLESMEFVFKILPTEIWVIDDGSKEDVVVPFVESLGNPHIKAIRQENMCTGGARNTGIDLSTGRYITFVDADDFIYYGPYVEILNVLKKKQPDILAQGYTFCYEGPATAFMLEHDICPSSCRYFIRRTTLGSLRFTPGIFHEDEEFNTKLHLLRAHLIVLNFSGYFYRYEPLSITHNKDPKHIRKRFDDYITIFEHLLSLNLPPTHEIALQRRLRVMAMCYVVTLMRDMDSASDIKSSLARLSHLGLYPLPLRWHCLRYLFVALSCRWPATVVLLAPLVKLIYRIQDVTAKKRAFTAHADPFDAEQP